MNRDTSDLQTSPSAEFDSLNTIVVRFFAVCAGLYVVFVAITLPLANNIWLHILSHSAILAVLAAPSFWFLNAVKDRAETVLQDLSAAKQSRAFSFYSGSYPQAVN
jgi:hypothetical protein